MCSFIVAKYSAAVQKIQISILTSSQSASRSILFTLRMVEYPENKTKLFNDSYKSQRKFQQPSSPFYSISFTEF